jgi:lambda family phage portal protein
LSAILGADAKPITREPLSARPRNRISAHYDGAQTTAGNSNYWASADSLSARAALSASVRKILRERARYEVANNCYAKGMLRTQADYVIGTGPRLQLLTEDKDFNRRVSTLFYEWAESIAFARKLWTLRFAWGVDGEGFALFINNENARHPVKLDLQLIECDQFTSNYFDAFAIDSRRDDGLVLDKYGNVVAYRMLPYHPGDTTWFMAAAEPKTIPADDVIHLFRCERPGQLRGVSEIAPALMLYPGLRRWTYAALSTAEKNARIYGVIKSNYSPADLLSTGQVEFNSAFANAPSAMDVYELEADTLLTMPDGWDMNAYRSEQPSSTYPEFKREIVSEMARCLNMPFNVAAANSAEYNFASGKLDHLPWWKSISIDQLHVSEIAATPTFNRWYYEARRIDGFLPIEPVEAAEGREWIPPHIWQWDGQDIIDPRESASRATALEFGFSTHARLYAKQGLDVDEEFDAQAKALGMSLDEYRAALRSKLFGADPLNPAAKMANQPQQTEQEAEDAVAA